MRKAALVTISAAVVFGMTACAPKTNVDTGAKNNVEATNTKTASVQADTPKTQKKIKPNFSKDFKYIKLNISEIAITPDEIDVGMNYQNISGHKVDWFPTNGHLIIGDMQLDASPLASKDLINGEIAPDIKADGTLVFKPQGDKKIDVNKVDKLKFDLDKVISSDLLGEKEVQFEIPVK